MQGFQDLPLVKFSPVDVSSEPCRSDANSPPGTHHASTSRATTAIAKYTAEMEMYTRLLDKHPSERTFLEKEIERCRKKLHRAQRRLAKQRSN